MHPLREDQPFLLPVVIDGSSEPSARVPDRLRERQWSRLTDEHAIAAFAARVSACIVGDFPSIAVLAFANRSNDPNDEYLSDGLAG